MSGIVYLDYAATTPVDPAVLDAMHACLGADELFANPSSAHGPGRQARARVEQARADVAALIGADPGEIVFTSGATESDNLAVIGAARFRRSHGDHIISAVTEHPAVVDSCRYLEQSGFRVTWLKPDMSGVITPESVAQALTPDTILVSLMHANNEIGVISDVAAIGALCREHGALFHVDAAQSAGRLPIDVRAQHIDLLSLSGHKLYGPKGAGALYLDAGRIRRIEPLMLGGGHERGLRPGTLATHQVAGLGKACELAKHRLASDAERIMALRERLWTAIRELPGVVLNGDGAERVCHILNVSVAGVEGESLMHELQGLAVSGGSACASDSDEISQVLRSLGHSDQLAQSSVRFSFGWETSEAEIDFAAACFGEAVTGLRRLAPGSAAPAPAGAFRGEAGDESLGARVVFTVRADGERISACEYSAYGCPATLAACEIIKKKLEKQQLIDMLAQEARALAAEIGAPAEKLGRLIIVQDALRNCFADWEDNLGQ